MNQNFEILDVLKQVKVNIPLLDAIKQIPSYAKFLKEGIFLLNKLVQLFKTINLQSLKIHVVPPFHV